MPEKVEEKSLCSINPSESILSMCAEEEPGVAKCGNTYFDAINFPLDGINVLFKGVMQLKRLTFLFSPTGI